MRKMFIYPNTVITYKSTLPRQTILAVLSKNIGQINDIADSIPSLDKPQNLGAIILTDGFLIQKNIVYRIYGFRRRRIAIAVAKGSIVKNGKVSFEVSYESFHWGVNLFFIIQFLFLVKMAIDVLTAFKGGNIMMELLPFMGLIIVWVLFFNHFSNLCNEYHHFICKVLKAEMVDKK